MKYMKRAFSSAVLAAVSAIQYLANMPSHKCVKRAVFASNGPYSREMRLSEIAVNVGVMTSRPISEAKYNRIEHLISKSSKRHASMSRHQYRKTVERPLFANEEGMVWRPVSCLNRNKYRKRRIGIPASKYIRLCAAKCYS